MTTINCPTEFLFGNGLKAFRITVRPATALFLVPGIYSAIENSANGGSCYLVSCKFLQKIVL